MCPTDLFISCGGGHLRGARFPEMLVQLAAFFVLFSNQFLVCLWCFLFYFFFVWLGACFCFFGVFSRYLCSYLVFSGLDARCRLFRLVRLSALFVVRSFYTQQRAKCVPFPWFLFVTTSLFY